MPSRTDRPRAHFCGAIAGSVPIRRGETPEQAIERAEATLLALFAGKARRLDVSIDLEENNTP